MDHIEQRSIDLEAILELIGEGAWSWDVTTGRIVHNATWSRLFGLSDAETEHRIDDVIARIHTDDKARLTLRIDESRDLRDRFEDRYRIRRTDGSTDRRSGSPAAARLRQGRPTVPRCRSTARSVT
ncbi:MAG: PAS domain-containing protein [Rhodobacter sp.]|nr:PAS domain-containing protein [Rhodobacter sp.]